MKLLSEIASISLGYSFRGAIESTASSSTRVIQMNDIKQDCNIDWDSLTKTELPGKKMPQWLREGDIIFVARGYNNIAIHLSDVPEECVCSPHFFVISINDPNFDPAFVAWQINQHPIQQWFNTVAAGAAQRSIPIKEIRNLAMKTIPIAEQKKVVALHQSCIREKQLYLNLIENREQTMFSISQAVLSKAS